MRKNLVLCSVLLALTLISCNKGNSPAIDCEEDCLFLLEQVEGEIFPMDCFNRMGIKTQKADGTEIYGLPDKMPTAFQQSEMKVIFTARCRENELESLILDPRLDFSLIFQMEILDIELKE